MTKEHRSDIPVAVRSLQPQLTLKDNIESVLARWAGKSSWPSTEATRESSLRLPSEAVGTTYTRHMGRPVAAYLLLSYQVDGQIYVAHIRSMDWHERYLDDPDSALSIQYNPNHPGRYYFAPACILTSRLVIALTIAIAVAVIALSIYIHG
jgi:hypothetical protein